MDFWADVLTASRIMIVLYILYLGLSQEEGRLLLIVGLTVIAWITDVLDGNFPRRAEKPTRLGRFDLATDLGLALVLSICMILWDLIPLLPAIVIWVVAGSAARFTHGQAPLQLAMGLVYSTLIFTLLKTHPFWGWTLMIGLWSLVVINRKRLLEIVSNFLDQISQIFQKI